MSLSGKRILLGISGGIAAYKCPDLVRQLKKLGAEVRVVMTESANYFVSSMSLQAVSANQVSTDLFDPAAELSMSHIELAKWADLVLIAPATANTIAKLAHGIADDLLSTLCLATPAPIAIAPAMNQQMYQAKATESNLMQLASRGILIWGPDEGFQACGDIGPGRMIEPSDIVENIKNYFFSEKSLAHLRITITAGPTVEEIDPVRYISNYSSGKMGFWIAKAAAEVGAQVTLISGPVHLDTPNHVSRIDVKSALDMYECAMYHAKLSDIFISCAAVADFRAVNIADKKMAKQENSDELVIKLVKNPDIVKSVASMKENRPFVVGFAAETHNIKEHALKKLANKKLDLICANNVADKNIGFNSDLNELSIYWQEGSLVLPLNHKSALAKQLIQAILTRYEVSQDEKKH